LKKLKFFSIFAFLFLLNGCMSDQQTVEDEFSSGDGMYRLAENMKRNGDYVTAIRLYNQALAIDPEYKKAQLALADALLLDGKLDESRTMLDKMLVKEPDNEEVLRELGKVTVAQNDPATCLKTYTALQKNKPQDANVFNGLGVCYDLSGQHDVAQEKYQKAMTLAPDNLNVRSNYGLSLALGGKTKEAIDILSKLAHRSDTTPNMRHNLAVAYGLAGEGEKAKRIFSHDLAANDLDQNIDILKSLQVSPSSQDDAASHKEIARPSSALTQNSDTVALPTSSIVVDKLGAQPSSDQKKLPSKKEKAEKQEKPVLPKKNDQKSTSL